MIVQDDESRVLELLAPLQRIEPVMLPSKRRRRPLLIAALIAAALVATGVAVAAGIGAFDGIGAADHPQTPQDVLDPVTAALLRSFNQAIRDQEMAAGLPEGAILPESARLVGQLPTGRRVYVVATTTDKLCVVIEQSATAEGRATAAASCGDPVSQAEPVTRATMDADGPGGAPPVSYGIARDGITSLSFRAGGSDVTVPATANVWAYEGESAVLSSVTIHYTDGRSKTLTH